jgi:magnesium transporter
MERDIFSKMRKSKKEEFVPVATGDELVEIKAQNLLWRHYTRPEDATREALVAYGAHQLDIEDVFSMTERPKVEIYDDYLFLVVHVPYFDKTMQRVLTGEIHIFVREGEMLSISHREIPSLLPFIKEMKSSPKAVFSQGSGYLLYKMVDHLVDSAFPMINKIGNKLLIAEEMLFQGKSEELVLDLSLLKQEIIAFKKTIRPQRQALKEMEKIHNHNLAPGFDFERYFDDILDAEESLWDLLDNYHEVVSGLEESNESLLSYDTAKSLKALTAITVIVLPLTLIASIFGMNIGLPGGGIPEASGLLSFAVIISFMFLLFVLQVIIFHRKKWL